ncbi:MAG: DUF3488 and transglutaminase-like domain-containing protein [Halobacteriales archaeon]
MSTTRDPLPERLDRLTQRYLGVPLPSPYEGLAGISAVILTAAYLGVLFHVVDVVGGVFLFVLELLVAFGLAVTLSKTLSAKRAVALGMMLLSGGLLVYLATVPAAYINVTRQITDTIALLTGLSILRITNAGVWVLGFTPAPVFVSWYFFLRREYIYGAVVGGAALGLLVLTGDAGTITALVGVLGVIGTIGFGDIEQSARARETIPEQPNVQKDARTLSKRLTRRMLLITVATTSVSVVPGGKARPLLPDRGTSSIEGSLVSNSERVSVLGSIRLTAKVRFTVTAEEAAYWRVGAYDRYTGSDWVRTGETRPYSGSLRRPPGDSRRIRQSFQVESAIDAMPAAWKPVRLGAGASQAEVTDLGGFRPVNGFEAGDQYSVESYQPEWTEEELRTAGTNYPPEIEQRYLQLPESTPQRLTRFTNQLVEGINNPYDIASRIERWLEANKEYSLDVNKPDGDIAAGFLFKLDRGYCVYYATTMVAMLRSQGIPARFVVGYTPGQQIEEDQWVVRGYHSHAWVEVYFPDVGWVQFDPTPSGPRVEAQNTRLQEARASGVEGIDTNESRQSGFTPEQVASTPIGESAGGLQSLGDETSGATPDRAPTENTTQADGLNRQTATAAGAESGGNNQGGGLGSLKMPDEQTMLYGLILFAGAATGAHRLGVFDRVYRELWLRRFPDGSPVERIGAAFDRVEYLLGRQYRRRRSDETPREYLESLEANIDDRIREVYQLYERTRYGGAVDEQTADRAAALTQELVDEHELF